MKPRLIKPTTGHAEPEVTPRTIKFDGDTGGFHLTADGIVVKGEPEFGDFEAATDFAHAMEERSPFWKADLLNYAYSRVDWQPFLDAVVNRWGLTPETLDQYRSVGKRVPKSERVPGLTFSHHEAVASLPAEEKRPMLERAKKEHLSVSALRQVVRKGKKVRRILKGQASELAKAHDSVVEHAHEAAELCRAIPTHDCHDAEKLIQKARRELDRVDEAVAKFRKAQGKA